MSTEQQLEAMGTQHSAHVVGSAFVQQYYHILHQSPELVYRFYQDTSKLGRSEDDGAMIPVSTMENMLMDLPDSDPIRIWEDLRPPQDTLVTCFAGKTTSPAKLHFLAS